MKIRRTVSHNVLLAAFYGGIIEVVWVVAYCAITGHSAAILARQITASLFPAVSAGAPGAALGVGLHFVLSLLVALLYVRLAWAPLVRRWSGGAALAAALGALALAWFVTFVLVLPVVNPVFAALLPYPVSLGAALLFAVAMAGALHDGVGQRMKHDRMMLPPAAA